ncbi:MAG: hypothetical protein H6621_04230 [Halobacteriovoraceae bacterium]|nr:hypothetical protein [Halobacteriovoraceae bacterium]
MNFKLLIVLSLLTIDGAFAQWDDILTPEQLQKLGAEYEPANHPIWEGIDLYSSPFLRKTSNVIDYKTPKKLNDDFFHLSVHPCCSPEEEKDTNGIELLAEKFQKLSIPSVLLDRYSNTLNRNFFDLEVNDYMSGGGEHLLSLTSSHHKVVITGGYIDGCAAYAMALFISQMKVNNQHELDFYIVRELATPFCQIEGLGEASVTGLDECLKKHFVKKFGIIPYLKQLVGTIVRYAEGLGAKADISYSFSFENQTVVLSKGQHKVHFHFESEKEVLDRVLND